ncbi:hypothetical protein D9M69_620030 [compost metagenome]
MTQSTGIKSIAFIMVIQQNTISASGAIHERSPWMMPLAWSSTISTIISTKAWKRPGTPEVTRRAAAYRNSTAMAPHRTDQNTVS